MDSEKYSDLTIVCGDRQFKVHKAIVCTASDVLRREVDGKMKEALTGVIQHDMFDADTVARMISYLYKQQYNVESDASRTLRPAQLDGDTDVQAMVLPDVNEKLGAHVRMYAIGQYYNIPTLRSLAVENFSATAEAEWASDGFMEVVKEVDLLTSRDDRELRNALRAVGTKHVEELVKDDVFMQALSDFDQMQDFAADILRQLVR